MYRLHCFAFITVLILSSLATAGGVNVDEFVENGVMMFADDSRGTPFAKDPAVVNFNGKYFMYYTMRPGNGIKGYRIGIATSDDLVKWDKVTELQPVQDCEKNGYCAPGAIVLDGKVHIFYQSYGNGRKDAICHAWSEDGVNFDRNPSNPIFSPTGDWCSGRAIDADVIEHGDDLLLFYSTRDPDMKVQMQGVASAPINSKFLREDWTQLNPDKSILKPELPWEKKCIEAAAACRHGDSLYMFYAGAYNNEPQQIGCAISKDGVSWERLFQEPFITNGKSGEWNSSESGHPYAFTDIDGTTYLFFQGNNDKGKSWYLTKVKIGWRDGLPFVDEG